MARETPRVLPRSASESVVAKMWSEVLGVEDVASDDDFFALGGDSLRAVQMLSTFDEVFAVSIPFPDFAASPTITMLMARIEQARTPQGHGPGALSGGPTDGAPCTLAQERLWFVEGLSGGRGLYNLPIALRIRDEINEQALLRSIHELVRRHDALRTTFALEDDQLVQLVHRSLEVEPTIRDLRESDDPEGGARRVTEEFAALPFDLEAGPLLRVQLIRVGDTDRVLQVVFHHIVCDGWSHVVFFRELGLLYEAYARNVEPELESPRLQYPDYARRERARVDEKQLDEIMAYWREKLDGIPAALDLPADRSRPPVSTYEGDTHRSTLGVDLVAGIRALSKAEGVTPFATLLAAFDALLFRYTNQETFVVGATTAGRDSPDSQRAIGMFTETVALRTDIETSMTFRDLLGQTRQTVIEAIQHDDAPFERLVAELEHERDLARHPIFQVLVSAVPEIPLTLPNAELFDTRKTTARVDLVLWLEERGSTYDLVWEYSTDLFDTTTIERLERHYTNLLKSVVADPAQEVAAIPLLDDGERRLVVQEWNETKREYPPLTLDALLKRQVAETPDAVAVEFEGASLTYAELDKRANQLAHFLRARGVEKQMLVAVYMERSLELVIALVAILKTGSAYVPLDPEYPTARIDFMLDDCDPAVILTQASLDEQLPVARTRVAVDAEWSKINEASDDDLSSVVAPEDLAYVIYTSGSTGRPKGAMNTHAAIVNRLLWMQDEYGLGSDDRVLQKTPYGFDVSVWEFFWPLSTGARLVLARPGGHKDPAYLSSVIYQHGVTTIHFVPSMMSVFVEQADHASCRSLRRVICSGEALRADLVTAFFERFDCELHNLYGPTECAVDVTAWDCRHSRGSNVVPIGRPIANTQIYVVDGQGQPTPIGVPGELWIGGIQVGRGYLNRVELTSDRFISNPFARGRVYRTGDLARWTPDGVVEFLGRIDDQVKLRGFRIEIGEITTVLGDHPAVSEGVVAAVDTPGGPELIAYVVPSMERAPSVRRLAQMLREERLQSADVYELPNGTVVAHVNPAETEILYEEIFGRDSYLKNGIGVPANGIVFDVGANIGLFALRAAQMAAGVRVFAFEPVPVVCDALRTNLELHGVQARVYEVAAAATRGSQSLTYFPHATRVSGSYADPEARTAVIARMIEGVDQAEVADVLVERMKHEELVRPTARISDVLREERLDRIDLLKIDVEGAEVDVLGGVEEDDWQKIRQVVAEVHEATALDGVTTSLSTRGFDVVTEQDHFTGLFVVYARRGAPVGQSTSETETWRSAERLSNDLREHLAAQLPEYMVPSSFVFLDEIPLTPNGKVDKKALPEPSRATRSTTSFVAPATPLELRIAKAWRDVLDVDPIGAHDNFFSLGGNSLLAARVVTRLRADLDIDLSIRSFFERPTVAGFAAQLADQPGTRRLGSEWEPQLTLPSADDGFPLSFAQEQLWFFDELAPGAAVYNAAIAVGVSGDLDIGALEEAIRTVIDRQEALRTVVVPDLEGHQQRVLDAWSFEVATLELNEPSDLKAEMELRASAPFDLEGDLMLRATVFGVSPGEHVILFQSHHIVFDGWSVDVFFLELGECYNAIRAGRVPDLPELKSQYRDFTLRQRDQLRGDRLRDEVSYWRRQLAGAPSMLALPADRPRSADHAFDGSVHRFSLTGDVERRVREASRRQGVTPYMFLLAVFATLLYRETGEDDIVIGTPIANRTLVEFEPLIGLLANTLALRIRLHGNPSFRTLLERVRGTTVDALDHQELPFGKVVDAVQPIREPGVNPVFQVNFRVRTRPPRLHLDGATTTLIPIDLGLSRFDLSFELHLDEDRIDVELGYNSHLFERSTAERLGASFAQMLEQALCAPDTRLLSFDGVGETGPVRANAKVETNIRRFRERARSAT